MVSEIEFLESLIHEISTGLEIENPYLFTAMPGNGSDFQVLIP